METKSSTVFERTVLELLKNGYQVTKVKDTKHYEQYSISGKGVEGKIYKEYDFHTTYGIVADLAHKPKGASALARVSMDLTPHSIVCDIPRALDILKILKPDQIINNNWLSYGTGSSALILDKSASNPIYTEFGRDSVLGEGCQDFRRIPIDNIEYEHKLDHKIPGINEFKDIIQRGITEHELKIPDKLRGFINNRHTTKGEKRVCLEET